MLSVRLGPRAGKRLDILCLGAHSDDIEIGCGATVLGMLAEHPRAVFHWVVLSSEGQRGAEARRSAARLLGRGSGANVIVKAFRSGYFPFEGAEIKDFFESLKRDLSPDLVFTHHREDRHQDHRMVSDLTWSTFRDHLVLEYEVPKYDGDLGTPNLFVPVDGRFARRKAHVILSSFTSQQDKHWFAEDVFLGLMRLRGVECASPTGYAEAFYARKTVLGLGGA
jgi:LmbE family N-acetylglucosaminyl deacetylase